MIAWNECFDPTPLLRPSPPPAPKPQRTEAPPPVNAAEAAWRIRRILVPTDFSPCSVQATAQAAELARQHDATLTILHVIDRNPAAARTHLGTAESLMRQLWIMGIAKLRRLAQALAQKHTKTETRIVEGLPAETIVENCSGFDLLVIGEQRPKPVRRFFSKRTARRVMAQAECPVLLVHSGADPAGGSRAA